MQSQIKRWGNSAAIRLPTQILAQANLDISSIVLIQVKDGKIEIESSNISNQRAKLPFSESDLLQGLDSYTAHSDALAEPASSESGF